nr:N(G),N(G)-dimethylarginine dimethylaminohydrolase [Anaerolineae bacterium]
RVQSLNRLPVKEDEAYAANCVWINGHVLVPAGYPKAKQAIENAGYATIEVDVSEFRKLDGGLSCLSLRF